MVSAGLYLLNALFGQRWERKWTSLLVGAIMYAGGWRAWTRCTTPQAWAVLYIIAASGTTLWLWSMYVYIPANYPTRMRSLGTGWTDGVGHLGAWGGVLIAGALFSAADPRNFVIWITIRAPFSPVS